MHKITVAKTAGFCFGVDRAVKLVYNELSKNERVCTYGPIIHNQHVTDDLRARGVRIIDRISDADRARVVIRSHGAGPSIYEEIAKNSLEFTDATCPYVARIHKIVNERSLEGDVILVAGDNTHPEVQAIEEHCRSSAIVFADETELKNIFKKNNKLLQKKVAIVAQTTYNIRIWDKCIKTAKEIIPDAKIFNTICSATSNRQEEAAELSQKSDIMIVIGGRHSSNTLKLADVCSQYCKTHLIEKADELCSIDFSHSNLIGITAGASTPAYIIKEVHNQMSEILQNMDEDFNFEEALEASFKKIYTGNRVKGYVTSVNNSEVIVDVGTKHTGYIPSSELSDDPNAKPTDLVKVGDEIDVIVIKINDQEGIVTLSKKKVDAMVGFENILKAAESGEVLEGVVTNVVKGGILVSSDGARVFIPASQATLRRDDKLEELLKKTVKFKILEVNEQRGRAVGSIRAVAKEVKDAAEKKIWDVIEVGNTYKGEVKSITNYGVFVDIGGVDGMVHISELSWNRIKHPSEVVKVGDVLEVYVKDADKETKRISLGYKKTEDNPWVKFEANYNVDDVVKATVVSITPFGAFAQIIPGIDGLIHISQIANKKVGNVKDILSVGQEVEAKITEIDIEKKRISISMRALLEEDDEVEAEVEETVEATDAE